MKNGKIATALIVLATVLITHVTTVSGYTVYEDLTWTMGEPDDECYTFGSVEERYFTNPACKELTDRIFTCLEGCYNEINARQLTYAEWNELVDNYGPYFCEEICYPKCQAQMSENDPLIALCEGKPPLPEEGGETSLTPLTPKTAQEELIEEHCKETCKNKYGPMTTGKTDENTPSKGQNSFIGNIDECSCTCEEGTIYTNRIVTKPYCGEVYDDTTNYCGPAGKFPVPRKPVGIDFNPACYNHDLCYETATSQQTCDRNMLKDMRAACNQETGLKRFICLGFARIYYQAVSTLGSILGSKN